jgi:hypothetical protein
VLRTLHHEIVDNLKRAIAEAESRAPQTESIPELIAARSWLFDNNTQYTDSSHLAAVLRFSRDLEDAGGLHLALDIAEYGRQLGPMFQYVEDPPFDQVYDDHAVYLRALLGQDTDRAVAHFEQKAVEHEPTHYGIRAAEVLVDLLVRLHRYEHAIAVFRRYLSEVPPDDLACASLPQLYQLTGDFEQLKMLAREHSEPLSYLAAVIQSTTDRKTP